MLPIRPVVVVAGEESENRIEPIVAVSWSRASRWIAIRSLVRLLPGPCCLNGFTEVPEEPAGGMMLGRAISTPAPWRGWREAQRGPR